MTTMTDARGLVVTAESPAELAAIDGFTNRLLRIDRGLEAILEDAKTFPETPMVQLLAAAFCLLGHTGQTDTAAEGFLAAGSHLLSSATARERRLHHALTLWACKDHLRALGTLEDIIGQWATDLLSAKLAEFFYYVLGQQHEARRFRAHMERLRDANRNDPDLLAMLAFARELCGDVTAAQRTVDQALAIEPRNPWAHHCVAHIQLRQGVTRAGIEVLESFLPMLLGAARFIHCHNAWHLALAHMEDMNLDRAAHVYTHHVGGITPDLVVEQIDAIAFLWRLEMMGQRADSAWSGLADRLERQVDRRYMPFIDAHAAYALARAGRDGALDHLLRNVAERSAMTDAETRRSWTPIGLVLVQASAAWGKGDMAGAARLLEPVITDVTTVGGSDAQVDLFRLAWFHALVRAGRKSDARTYWNAVTADRPHTPADRYRFGLAGG